MTKHTDEIFNIIAYISDDVGDNVDISEAVAKIEALTALKRYDRHAEVKLLELEGKLVELRIRFEGGNVDVTGHVRLVPGGWGCDSVLWVGDACVPCDAVVYLDSNETRWIFESKRHNAPNAPTANACVIHDESTPLKVHDAGGPQGNAGGWSEDAVQVTRVNAKATPLNSEAVTAVGYVPADLSESEFENVPDQTIAEANKWSGRKTAAAAMQRRVVADLNESEFDSADAQRFMNITGREITDDEITAENERRAAVAKYEAEKFGAGKYGADNWSGTGLDKIDEAAKLEPAQDMIDRLNVGRRERGAELIPSIKELHAEAEAEEAANDPLMKLLDEVKDTVGGPQGEGQYTSNEVIGVTEDAIAAIKTADERPTDLIDFAVAQQFKTITGRELPDDERYDSRSRALDGSLPENPVSGEAGHLGLKSLRPDHDIEGRR